MSTSKTHKNNSRKGGSLDDFLREDGLLEEVELAALKRALAMKLADLVQKKGTRKADLARAMGTSRAVLDRLLDPEYPSVTLSTLARAANALGRRVRIDFVPA